MEIPTRRLAQFVRRNQFLFIGLCSLYALVTLAFSFDEKDLPIVYQMTERPFRATMTALFGITSIFILYRFLRFYLNPDDAEDEQLLVRVSGAGSEIELIRKDAAEANRQTKDVLASIEKRISGIGGRAAPQLFESAEEGRSFKEKLAQEIVKEATSNIDQGIVTKLSSQSKFEDAEKYQNQTRDRLYRVVLGLERRANLNLSVGAIIGGLGIGILIYLLYISPPNIGPTPDHVLLAIQYFSRVSIVFLVEVFAFFFLKLYSQTLSELRHTHNEITNTEMKSSGLQVAIASSDKKSIAHAAQSAINTERNFLLDKGKTTIDLERYRNDGEQSAITLNILKEMFFPSSKLAPGKREK